MLTTGALVQTVAKTVAPQLLSTDKVVDVRACQIRGYSQVPQKRGGRLADLSQVLLDTQTSCRAGNPHVFLDKDLHMTVDVQPRLVDCDLRRSADGRTFSGSTDGVVLCLRLHAADVVS